MISHWARRADWPDRDPPGHLYMGRAILRLGRILYPAVWTDEDMLKSGPARSRYLDTREKLVGWMLDESLPFAIRNHRGGHDPSEPEIWASASANDYADLCRIGRVGGFEVYYQPVDVQQDAFERLVKEASRDIESERARELIPPSADDNRRAWVGLPKTLDEAFRRLEAVGEPKPSRGAVARALSAMWADIGNRGGTPETFETYLRDLDDERFKKSPSARSAERLD